MALQLIFGLLGNAEPYMRTGWSEPEDEFIWSVGPLTTLSLPVPTGQAEPIRLELRVEPNTTRLHPAQTLRITANQFSLGTITLDAEATLRATIPADAYAGASSLELTFHQPDAHSPLQAGESGDDRELAFAFRELTLEPDPAASSQPSALLAIQPSLPPTLAITFGKQGNAAEYQRAGWAEPDDEFTSSIGAESRLLLPVPQGADDRLLDIHLAPHPTPGQDGQTLVVLANGAEICRTYVAAHGIICIPLPSRRLGTADHVEICLVQPDAPAHSGLGFAVHGLWLRPDQTRPAHRPHAPVTQPPDSALRLSFGQAGNAAPFQREGWSDPEEGFTWSVGQLARLRLPITTDPADLMLELQLEPFAAPPLAGQNLHVSANGTPIGETFLTRAMTLWFRVPAACIAGAGSLEIAFRQPDAIHPAAAGDDRKLAFAFRALAVFPAPTTPTSAPITLPPLPMDTRDATEAAVRHHTFMALADLMLCFESLGHNCEFGLVQRHFGAEPSALLRFAGILQPDLVTALRERFRRIAEPKNLKVREVADRPDLPPEWVVHDSAYGTTTHTFVGPQDAGPNLVLWQAQKLYQARYRDMAHHLRTGEKIFVFQHRHARSLAAIEPIAACLAPHTLLWVAEATGHKSGSVTRLRPGLLLGAIDQLAPETAEADSDQLAWASVLANAYLLWK